jgi:diaminohydroxyphosphoribosylaminopyrimidine deaminase/5-amino-6-(5-phosphoribosylamino)uracil reductase
VREDCVQEVAAVIAPKLMGGQPARTPLGELGYGAMAEVPLWHAQPPQALGRDLLWRLTPPAPLP